MLKKINRRPEGGGHRSMSTPPKYATGLWPHAWLEMDQNEPKHRSGLSNALVSSFHFIEICSNAIWMPYEHHNHMNLSELIKFL